jgi:hypothetical protein
MLHLILESNENITQLEKLWVWGRNMIQLSIQYLAVSIVFTLMWTTHMWLKNHL